MYVVRLSSPCLLFLFIHLLSLYRSPFPASLHLLHPSSFSPSSAFFSLSFSFLALVSWIWASISRPAAPSPQFSSSPPPVPLSPSPSLYKGALIVMMVVGVRERKGAHWFFLRENVKVCKSACERQHDCVCVALWLSEAWELMSCVSVCVFDALFCRACRPLGLRCRFRASGIREGMK